MKTDLSNRVKPTRWKTINSKIQNIIKKYNLTPTKFLNVGAGKKNPYALPILWYLNGAQKLKSLNPIRLITYLQYQVFKNFIGIYNVKKE